MSEKGKFYRPLLSLALGGALLASWIGAPRQIRAEPIQGLPDPSMWTDCGLQPGEDFNGRAVFIRPTADAPVYEHFDWDTQTPVVAYSDSEDIHYGVDPFAPAEEPLQNETHSSSHSENAPEAKAPANVILQENSGPFGAIEIKTGEGETVTICIREQIVNPTANESSVAFLSPPTVYAEQVAIREFPLETAIDKTDLAKIRAQQVAAQTAQALQPNDAKEVHTTMLPATDQLTNEPFANSYTYPDTTPPGGFMDWNPNGIHTLPTEAQAAELVPDPNGDGFVYWDISATKNEGCDVPNVIRLDRAVAGAVVYMFGDDQARNEIVTIMAAETGHDDGIVKNKRSHQKSEKYGYDYGVSQVNWGWNYKVLEAHGFTGVDDLMNVVQNIYAARLIYESRGLSWSAWNAPKDRGCIVQGGTAEHELMNKLASHGLAQELGTGGEENQYVAYRVLSVWEMEENRRRQEQYNDQREAAGILM